MKVLIAGGGTGGHLFPGIAVAEELRSRRVDVVFAGTQQGIESTEVPKHGFPLETIPVSGLMRVGMTKILAGVAKLPRAMWAARSVLTKHAPDVVVGIGGYASGPVAMAAIAMGIPTAVLEQNSVPGLTNRLVGRFSNRVFGSFESSRAFFPGDRFVLSGNPLRKRIVDLAEREADDALVGESAAHKETRILVVGGSQGARALNEIVPDALAKVGSPSQIKHQSGAREVALVEERYRKCGVVAEVTPFILDMAAAYLWADIVIARAGATTIAELMAVGRAAVFIPLPTAVSDHQTKNAAALEAVGAAIVMAQSGCTPDRLAPVVGGLCVDVQRRREMARAARALGRPQATREIADALVELAEKGTR